MHAQLRSFLQIIQYDYNITHMHVDMLTISLATVGKTLEVFTFHYRRSNNTHKGDLKLRNFYVTNKNYRIHKHYKQ